MNHDDHVRLICGGIEGLVWADMGSGTGYFTLALADILGMRGKVYSVEVDHASLLAQRKNFEVQFPDFDVEYIEADFSKKIDLPMLDGIVAANSLHFEENHVAVLKLFRQYLKPEGRLVVVEYNADKGNEWVPFSISYEMFEREAERAGYSDIRMLESIPSDFLGEIYSALAVKSQLK